MSDIAPTPFGDKYVLVEHIATGGMAEIYRANYTGIEGFAKELVIKQLRTEFAAQPRIVQMFLQEARVAATLTHNNVVHTYDLGELDGEYYIAMELLKGEELVEVLRRCAGAHRAIPLEIALGVIMQSLEGLHYVHARTDPSGTPLGLVHRDINPTNIHVGYDGVCKILDFGIAATRATAVAKAGELAGKLAYMAPEQVLRQPLDPRADIFAMGIVMYEMCLGKRLFRGPKDEVMRRVTEGDVPAPTFVNPEFPPNVEAVIMKALEVDPAERYQNCDHMFRDLERCLTELGLSCTPRKVSAFMSELFGEGVPAEVNYDDEYGDLDDDALDFDDYENLAGDAPEEAPDWVRKLETGRPQTDTGRHRRRASMTIGNLEALVAAPAADRAAGARSAGRGARRTGSHAVARAPEADPASSSTATGRHSGIHRALPRESGGFGSGVVKEERRRGGSLGWLLGIVGVGGLAYLAYSVLTVK